MQALEFGSERGTRTRLRYVLEVNCFFVNLAHLLARGATPICTTNLCTSAAVMVPPSRTDSQALRLFLLLTATLLISLLAALSVCGRL